MSSFKPMKSRLIWVAVVGVATLLVACGAEPDNRWIPDKAEVAIGKADGTALCTQLGYAPDCDLCDLFGWYGDGECDQDLVDAGICLKSDPDCNAIIIPLDAKLSALHNEYQGEFEELDVLVQTPVGNPDPALMHRVLVSTADVSNGMLDCLGVNRTRTQAQIQAWEAAGLDWFSGSHQVATVLSDGKRADGTSVSWYDYYQVDQDYTGYNAVTASCWLEVQLPDGRVVHIQGTSEQDSDPDSAWAKVVNNYVGAYEGLDAYLASPAKELPAQFCRREHTSSEEIRHAMEQCLGVPAANVEGMIDALSKSGVNWFTGDLRTFSFDDKGYVGDYYSIGHDYTGYGVVLATCWFEVAFPDGRVFLLQGASEQ